MFDFDSPLSQLFTFLFPNNCFEEIFIKFNIIHDKCMPLVISRFLSFGITLGALFVKVPQIQKIWSARSGAGLSMLSCVLELVCVASTAAYSHGMRFPMGTWGEALFIFVQTLVICLLILWFRNRQADAFVFFTVCLILSFAAYLRLIPIAILSFGQLLNIPVIVVARGMQISENYRNQSTGQLSAISVILIFAGSLARIFTSTQELGDRLTIVTYCIAATMNAILTTQILIYWDKDPKRKEQ